MPLQRRIYKSRFFDPREELLFIGEEIRYSRKGLQSSLSFSTQRKQNSSDKSQALRYSSEQKHCLPQKIQYSFKQNLTFKQVYQKYYCSSLKTQYLSGRSVILWFFSKEFLSFAQEWVFRKDPHYSSEIDLALVKNEIQNDFCWENLCALRKTGYSIKQNLLLQWVVEKLSKQFFFLTKKITGIEVNY